MVCFFLIPGFPSNAVGEYPRRKKVRTNLGIKSAVLVLMLKMTLPLFGLLQSRKFNLPLLTEVGARPRQRESQDNQPDLELHPRGYWEPGRTALGGPRVKSPESSMRDKPRALCGLSCCEKEWRRGKF